MCVGSSLVGPESTFCDTTRYGDELMILVGGMFSQVCDDVPAGVLRGVPEITAEYQFLIFLVAA